MLLDLESLRCFDAVATQLNFRAAAERLSLSPAALSDRIRRLEETLDEDLFVRTTRRVALTEAGSRLLPHARRLLEEAARSFPLVKGSGQAPPLELWVGTRFELGLSWLVPGLPRLEAAAPGRTLHLVFGDGPDLITKLKQGALDCIVTSSRAVEGAMDYRVLHPERYVLVGSAALLERAPFRKPADAPAHSLLDLSPDLPLSRYFLDQAGGSAAWKFQRLEYLGTIAAVRLRVLQGRGLAVLPEYFVAEDVRKGRLKRLLPRVTLQTDHFRLMWRKGHGKAAALQTLAEQLQGMPLR